MSLNADNVRLLFTYTIAALVLVGCFVLLTFPSQVTADQLLPFITGIIGGVLAFVFNRESTTAGQRSAERAVSLGATTASPTTVTNAETVQSGGPTTVSK